MEGIAAKSGAEEEEENLSASNLDRLGGATNPRKESNTKRLKVDEGDL